MSPARTARTREPDQACAEAVDLARAAVVEVVGAASVGEHLEVQADDERVVTHVFGCADPAYQGWRWAVTVVRAPRAKVVTVSEAVLLPGPEALLAPAWVPWHDRLRPGDLGVGDLLPAPPDDERLVPLVVLEGDDAVTDWYSVDEEADPAKPATWPAPGRSRVLSAVGRDGASARWYTATRPADTAGARCSRPVHQLRLLRPAQRRARPAVRRLRERLRAGRRPGGLGRPWLRGALRIGGVAGRGAFGRAGHRYGLAARSSMASTRARRAARSRMVTRTISSR